MKTQAEKVEALVHPVMEVTEKRIRHWEQYPSSVDLRDAVWEIRRLERLILQAAARLNDPPFLRPIRKAK